MQSKPIPLIISSTVPTTTVPTTLGAKEKTEMHILTAPHDVISSPGIVEEVAVNAGGKIGQAVRKAQGRLNTQCHDRCVQGFDKKGHAVILVAESFRECVHMTVAGRDHVQGKYRPA